MRTDRLLFVAAMVFSTAASAQFHSSPAHVPHPSAAPISGAGSPGIDPDIGLVLNDIHEGVSSGQLSHVQARHLRQEAGEIRELENRYSSGGLSEAEESELLNRVEVLRAITNAKRSGTIK